MKQHFQNVYLQYLFFQFGPPLLRHVNIRGLQAEVEEQILLMYY